MGADATLTDRKIGQDRMEDAPLSPTTQRHDTPHRHVAFVPDRAFSRAPSSPRSSLLGSRGASLVKPDILAERSFRDQDLLDAIELGLVRDRARRENEKVLDALKERFEALTSREREIMIQVARGRLSKQIAFDFGVSEATVKVHRMNLMRKMKATSLPELGRMADKLNLVS